MPGNPFRNRTIFAAAERAVKVKTFRSKPLREAVAELPCVICGREKNTQAAHCDIDKGMGIKSTDASVMALCVGCHYTLGSTGSVSRDEKRATEDMANLKTLRLLIENGVLHL